MHVNEPGRDHQSGGIDPPLGIAFDTSDGENPISFDSHIAVEPWVARAIDDFSAADDEVVVRTGSAKIDAQ